MVDSEEPPPIRTVLGLDRAHSSLLETLITRVEWTRVELEELCDDRGLMTDGALEHLNEASFERLEMPLFEGEDPIQMNAEALARLSSGDDSHA